jgi:MFS transporter, MHS family, proline/betaine transporter
MQQEAVAESARRVAGASLPRVIAAASIGNALEWFDLLAYGYFAVTISQLFFPSDDPAVSLLLALGTFGVSYLVRPIGAVVLGSYADRAGRKSSLMVSILLMTAGTLLMAVMPNYRTIGVVAPVAVLAARLLQGFSVGGEFGSSTSFLVEHAPHRAGFLASFQWAGQGLASVLSSLFGIGLAMLTPAALDAWGWRLPYVFGLLIAPVGFYIRCHLDETPQFLALETARAPLREVLRRQHGRVLGAIGVAVVSNSANYVILYMPTYAIRQLGLPAASGFIATLLGAAILTLGAPVIGHWSDGLGRTRLMLAAAALFAISSYPAFALLTALPSLATLIAIVCWLSLLKTMYSGVLPSLLAEIFPVHTRATGLALSYNLSVPIFGGFAPFICAWLITATGSNLAPGLYLVATALLSLAALLALRARLLLA